MSATEINIRAVAIRPRKRHSTLAAPLHPNGHLQPTRPETMIDMAQSAVLPFHGV